jgi:hypothetical protein
LSPGSQATDGQSLSPLRQGDTITARMIGGLLARAHLGTYLRRPMITGYEHDDLPVRFRPLSCCRAHVHRSTEAAAKPHGLPIGYSAEPSVLGGR